MLVRAKGRGLNVHVSVYLWPNYHFQTNTMTFPLFLLGLEDAVVFFFNFEGMQYVCKLMVTCGL